MKIKENTELIFTDGKTLMEKVTVTSIDKKQGFALLSNKVKVVRTSNPDNTFPRIDQRGEGYCLPLTEENEKKFEAYKAYFRIQRQMESLPKKIQELKGLEDPDKILTLEKKINKVVETLNK